MTGESIALSNAERFWSPVEATITSGDVSSTTNKGVTTWDVVWGFAYTVDGIRYAGRSDGIPFGTASQFFSSSEAAEKDRVSRPVGATVTAWHDPNDPSRAVLDRRSLDDRDQQLLWFSRVLLATAAMLFAVKLTQSYREWQSKSP